MDQERKGAINRRLRPLGMSLAAAVVTAAALAAISVATGEGGSDEKGGSGTNATRPGPPGGGPGVMMFGDRLSEEDRQKLEEFRQCMEDNGAPAPPEPGEIDPSEGPPEPPSEAEREKMEAAFEACKEKLPEDLRDGPPHFGGPGCAPPPGAQQEQGQNRQGSSSQSGTQSSGAAA